MSLHGRVVSGILPGGATPPPLMTRAKPPPWYAPVLCDVRPQQTSVVTVMVI